MQGLTLHCTAAAAANGLPKKLLQLALQDGLLLSPQVQKYPEVYDCLIMVWSMMTFCSAYMTTAYPMPMHSRVKHAFRTAIVHFSPYNCILVHVTTGLRWAAVLSCISAMQSCCYLYVYAVSLLEQAGAIMAARKTIQYYDIEYNPDVRDVLT